MEVINIVVSRNHSEQDWSVEIDGQLHDHISDATVDGLIDQALVFAQRILLEREDSNQCGAVASGVSGSSG